MTKSGLGTSQTKKQTQLAQSLTKKFMVKRGETSVKNLSISTIGTRK